MTQIEQELKEFILKELVSDRLNVSLAENSPLLEGGVIDSLGIFQVIGFLEERYGITIEDDDVVLENFETLRAIMNLIMSKLTARPSM